MTFNIKINEKIIKLQIWDSCGIEIYRSLIASFYRNSSLAILFYSINNKESFIHLENWLRDFKTQCNPDAKIILVGNKCDLESERKVSKEEGEKFKTDNKLNMFFESSAKTGYNAQKIFIEASQIID